MTTFLRTGLALVVAMGVGMVCGCESGSDEGDGFPSGLVWLAPDISGWAETARLDVSFSGGTIHLDYDQANSWPSAYGANANVWVLANYGGVWYAGTWEWLHAGQTAKPMSSVNGAHIKVPPLSSWNPHSGERLGFMVSGLCRDSKRSVDQRSNVFWTNWP